MLYNFIPYPTGYPWDSPAGGGAEKAGSALSSTASETSSKQQGSGKTQGREELGSAPVKPAVIHSLFSSHLPKQAQELLDIPDGDKNISFNRDLGVYSRPSSGQWLSPFCFYIK